MDGSQTPNTNIDLSNFEECVEFFNKIGILVDEKTVYEIKDEIDAEGVHLSNSYISEYRKNFINYVLEKDGVLDSGPDYYGCFTCADTSKKRKNNLY